MSMYPMILFHYKDPCIINRKKKAMEDNAVNSLFDTIKGVGYVKGNPRLLM